MVDLLGLAVCLYRVELLRRPVDDRHDSEDQQQDRAVLAVKSTDRLVPRGEALAAAFQGYSQ